MGVSMSCIREKTRRRDADEGDRDGRATQRRLRAYDIS